MRTIRSTTLRRIVACLMIAGCHTGEPIGDHHHDGASTTHEEHGHGDEHGEEGIVELTPKAISRIGLETVPATVQPLATQRITTGQLGFDEERLAHVAPRVSGRLVHVPAALGANVAAGEVLAVVDSTELGEAKAAFLRARARHEVAARQLERERDLQADQIASEKELLEAEAEARETAAELAARREILRLIGLTSEAIEHLRWDDTEASQVVVRAPFAGRIVAREATLGELVSVEDVLFTLADLSQVWLWIDLYERDLAHVQTGETVEVRLDTWPDEVLPGEITYIADQLDAESRTVRARVDLPNPTRRLKPGMFARVKLAASDERPSTALAVPRTAIQRDGEASIVFVETGPGRFERREVELGRVTDELVEILAGVSSGARVVTQGAFLLKSQTAGDEIGGHHH